MLPGGEQDEKVKQANWGNNICHIYKVISQGQGHTPSTLRFFFHNKSMNLINHNNMKIMSIEIGSI